MSVPIDNLVTEVVNIIKTTQTDPTVEVLRYIPVLRTFNDLVQLGLVKGDVVKFWTVTLNEITPVVRDMNRGVPVDAREWRIRVQISLFQTNTGDYSSAQSVYSEVERISSEIQRKWWMNQEFRFVEIRTSIDVREVIEHLMYVPTIVVTYAYYEAPVNWEV